MPAVVHVVDDDPSVRKAVSRAATSILTKSSVAPDESTVARYPQSPRAHQSAAGSNPCPFGNLGRMGTVVSFFGGSQLYGESDPADYLYCLVSGVARGYRMTPDGRRQVVAFYVPGDLFGFELGSEHTFSVEAVSNTRVRMIKRTIISAIVARDQDVADELLGSLARELGRNQRHVRRLGKTAPERVASFVLELAERLSKSGIVDVPMTRRDIADYLGVTIETVSRTLTLLTNMAAVAMFGPRKIAILNSGLLQRFASDTTE
jgi:CRP/FNR family nitrogen fixation transcriptional regulator